MWGYAGNDDLNGGVGRDTLAGQKGDDLLSTRDDEPDSVNCGADEDYANVDPAVIISGRRLRPGDTINYPGQCEKVETDGPMDPLE